jgi:hypothetical protein
MAVFSGGPGDATALKLRSGDALSSLLGMPPMLPKIQYTAEVRSSERKNPYLLRARRARAEKSGVAVRVSKDARRHLTFNFKMTSARQSRKALKIPTY